MELQIIQNRIYQIRGLNVMLDFDLAEMYNVQTKRLKEQVRRNIERFPSDFMFELTKTEWIELVAICDQLPENLKHSTVTPFAFTQEGVAMLSGVLRSPTAIEVNISIMRAFVALRQYALGYAELNQKLETFMIETNMQFNEIYQALTELASQKEEENKPRKRIGYVRDE
ncbi:ORF6N domain-containing protein [uncultured Dysgonomonas sp.]|uniref:ORF6N domain-containing protein n=1 Tax=uncultured Dysgonomonas sp. TaxID=206096 RepID=UPI002805DAE1|nr:ORF6N domain-containing protein [uncultured Dysgonomonas sp.]